MFSDRASDRPRLFNQSDLGNFLMLTVLPRVGLRVLWWLSKQVIGVVLVWAESGRTVLYCKISNGLIVGERSTWQY